MATNITTITKRDADRSAAPQRRLPGWAWFVLLWLGGVVAAVSLGEVFKVFMNLTLFAVR
ncbi:hypothetical protein [Paraburkholderia sp.]|uniref:hypothetical protein n=1 Tax=Paraburkholderia sp. TaxID=1926495 RepID=UPI002392B3EA|nr:hypothetical protein [Paraburkholderia sp.]MDE1181757.1 hypothetical protein [Paraburkholderia sp.]